MFMSTRNSICSPWGLRDVTSVCTKLLDELNHAKAKKIFMKSFIPAVLNHSAHTQLRHIQNRSISTHLDKKELLVYLFIVNVPFNSLMSAVLPLKALIVLPNKLILLVDRIFVNLQVLLLCFLLLFWSTCRHSRWWWSKAQWQREPQPRTGRLKKQKQNLRIKRHVLKHLLYYISLRQAMKRKVIAF